MATSPASEQRADYAAASSLVGAVLSLIATQLARERSRARSKPERVARLEAYRTDALRTLRQLEPENADAVSDKFATLYLTLLADEPADRMPLRMVPTTAIAI